jgi:hypothetical protein
MGLLDEDSIRNGNDSRQLPSVPARQQLYGRIGQVYLGHCNTFLDNIDHIFPKILDALSWCTTPGRLLQWSCGSRSPESHTLSDSRLLGCTPRKYNIDLLRVAGIKWFSDKSFSATSITIHIIVFFKFIILHQERMPLYEYRDQIA